MASPATNIKPWRNVAKTIAFVKILKLIDLSVIQFVRTPAIYHVILEHENRVQLYPRLLYLFHTIHRRGSRIYHVNNATQSTHEYYLLPSQDHQRSDVIPLQFTIKITMNRIAVTITKKPGGGGTVGSKILLSLGYNMNIYTGTHNVEDYMLHTQTSTIHTEYAMSFPVQESLVLEDASLRANICYFFAKYLTHVERLMITKKNARIIR